MRTLAYKFRLRATRTQSREMDRFCGASRYAWNWGLAEYESALDETRASVPDEDGKRATGSVRDILERRMIERGVEVRRRGAGKSDPGRTLALKSVIYALWCHHRDTEAPPWVRQGVHSHVASYALQRLCDTVTKWWKAKGKRAPWTTASERRGGKRAHKRKRGSQQQRTVGPPRYKRSGDNPSFTIQARGAAAGRLIAENFVNDTGARDTRTRRVGRSSARDANVDRLRVRVPGGIGWVRVEDAGRNESPISRIPAKAVPKTVTVRKIAGRWEISVTVTEPWATPDLSPGPACGIDLGMNAEATIAWSDGRIERVEPPRPMANLGLRLVLLQRKLGQSRHVLRCMVCEHESPLEERAKRIRKCRQPVERDGATEECGGRIRRWRSIRGMRLKMRLARLHAHIAYVRADHIHKLTDRLTREAATICTEPHNITGLVSAGVAKRCEKYFRKGLTRRAVRRAMLDIGWGELRRQLHYKSGWRGVDYHTQPEGSLTDKTCHRCSRVNLISDDTSEYRCEECHWEGTRQENTALACLEYAAPEKRAAE